MPLPMYEGHRPSASRRADDSNEGHKGISNAGCYEGKMICAKIGWRIVRRYRQEGSIFCRSGCFWPDCRQFAGVGWLSPGCPSLADCFGRGAAGQWPGRRVALYGQQQGECHRVFCVTGRRGSLGARIVRDKEPVAGCCVLRGRGQAVRRDLFALVIAAGASSSSSSVSS